MDSDEEPVIFNRNGDLTSLSPSEGLSLDFTEVHKESQTETLPLDDLVGPKEESKISSTSTDSGLSLHSDLDRSFSNQVFKVIF